MISFDRTRDEREMSTRKSSASILFTTKESQSEERCSTTCAESGNAEGTRRSARTIAQMLDYT